MVLVIPVPYCSLDGLQGSHVFWLSPISWQKPCISEMPHPSLLVCFTALIVNTNKRRRRLQRPPSFYALALSRKCKHEKEYKCSTPTIKCINCSWNIHKSIFKNMWTTSYQVNCSQRSAAWHNAYSQTYSTEVCPTGLWELAPLFWFCGWSWLEKPSISTNAFYSLLKSEIWRNWLFVNTASLNPFKPYPWWKELKAKH